MNRVQGHILVADLGGTHLGLAIMAHGRDGRLEPVRHETRQSKDCMDFAGTLRSFLSEAGRDLDPPVRQACIDFAGPVGPDRSEALVTNLGWGFTAADVLEATGVEELTLLNDFEAVGFGLEVLLAHHPEAFVRLSPEGKIPGADGAKPTLVIIGAGTGLGTSILVQDQVTGKYRPIPGEGGHTDFVPIEEAEFRIARWIRENVNRSKEAPVYCERVVSGPGLVNVYRAINELEADDTDATLLEKVMSSTAYDQPALIVKGAQSDPVCRRALDIWLKCYARAAKNSAIFPLAPGGVYLAGGIAAKILPEMKSGLFMREFRRHDIPHILALLENTPVFVVTDYRIGLFGCANVAVNFHDELGYRA